MASKVEEMVNGRPESHDGVDDLISALPRDDRWVPLCLYGGFWLFVEWMPGRLAAQQRMVGRDDDILVASVPKSGMTWLKSLVFAVVWRGSYPPGDPLHPLRRASPHDCVEFVEELFTQGKEANMEALPSPRILSTHTPYSLLSASIRESGCRVVYICRDPRDTFVSSWHFRDTIGFRNKEQRALPVEEAFEMFCSGIWPCGPFWENVLEFWNESLRRPDKVFFLRYEDMKADPAGNLRKLAAFLGQPFSEEEEQGRTVRDVLELCSFKSLKSMEVNKSGKLTTIKTMDLPRSSFFRRGNVGDWVNHVTLEMAEKVDRITLEKLQGSGLKLGSSSTDRL